MAQISFNEYKALKLYEEISDSKRDVDAVLDGVTTASFMNHSPTDRYFSDVYYRQFVHIFRLLEQLINRDSKELLSLVDAFVGLDKKLAGQTSSSSSNPLQNIFHQLTEASERQKLLSEGKEKYESLLGGGNGAVGGGGSTMGGGR